MNKVKFNLFRVIPMAAMFLLPCSFILRSHYRNTEESSTPLYKTGSLKIHGLYQDFVRIPEGEFMMGSDERPEEKPVHKVKVESFDFATSEVTVFQFRAFVQATGYKTDAEIAGSSFACCWRPKLGITWLNPGFFQADNEPVVAISWNDAVAFCRWLSAETGEEYRLPSEAEWEYACLTGKTSIPGHSLDSIAWFSENSGGRTHPVATKGCNKYGMYDMIGNSWEWVSDDYHNSYSGAPSTSLPWISSEGDGRVLRGGSWGLSEKMHPVSYDLRITSRPVFGKDNSCNNSGFRLARSINNQSVKTLDKKPDKLTACNIEYELVWLPAGQFLMGEKNGSREAKPVHKISFNTPFGVGKTEITVEQFRSFVNSTDYKTDAEKSGKCWDSDFRSRHTSIRQTGLNWRNPGFAQTESDPVTCVTWNDAISFCSWLSGQTGYIVRLPSEAEWEYAMCGRDEGSKDMLYDESSWYFNNSEFKTHPVGQKSPNLNGLYDMMGNVSEWTNDIWHADYTGAPDDGSSWLGLPVNARVVRGGSFERETNEMGPRGRDWYAESEAVTGSGFRIVVAGISTQKN